MTQQDPTQTPMADMIEALGKDPLTPPKLKQQFEDWKVDLIAKVCHEVNRAYCHAIGDTTAQPWDYVSEGIRNSARTGVRKHLEANLNPEQSHNSWMQFKKEEGWIYGPVKDEAKLEHPCMVPYGELPQEQRVKDYLFKAVVDSLKS